MALRLPVEVPEIPNVDMPLDELAEWFAKNLDQVQAWDSFMYRAKRRLNEAVRDQGPLQTRVGKLAIEATGYEYPLEIGDEFPTLGKHTVTATVDTIEQAERILDLVTEQDPAAEVGHSMKVDGRLANSWLKTADAASALRLMQLRKPKGKLVLK